MNHPIGHSPTDRQLVELVLGGDKRAFNLILAATERLVAQIVFKLIADEEDRKDVAQDIYLKVYHHLKGFKFQSKLSTWVGQIAYNTCLNRLQKRKINLFAPPEGTREDPEKERHEDFFRSTDETDQGLLQKELTGLITRELSRLPPLYQTLIGLFHQQELSYQEIAGITGLPEGTIKSYLFRARRLLKETALSIYKKETL